MSATLTGWEILDRMVQAVDAVKNRLLRSTAALSKANVPYAVIGGNAVALWVSEKDEAAVRNTQDVDVMIDRKDLDAAIEAMEAAGFSYRRAAGIDMFLDGPKGRARDAVHVLYAGEKVRQEYPLPAPTMNEITDRGPYKVLNLDALVRMKLTSNRRKDQVHVDDLISVGWVDETWLTRLPPELSRRLQHILDTPDG